MTPPELDAPSPTSVDAAPTRLPSRLTRWVGPILVLLVLLVAGLALHNELRHFRYHDIARALAALSRERLVLAIGLALSAYLVLPGYDAIALAAIGKPAPFARVAFSSFIAYAISQTLGFPLVTGSSVRYRFWTAWGLTTPEIGSAIGYVVATFTVGLVAMSGLSMVVEPGGTAALLRLPIPSLRPVGAFFLLVVAGYLGWAAIRRGPIRVRGWTLPVPSFRLAVAQLGVAALDWSLAASVLFVLLPHPPGLSFPVVLGAFLTAQFLGIASHVPGGLGVFEGLMVVLLEPYLDVSLIFGALLAFRAVYYLLPFSLGLLLLAGFEVAQPRPRLRALGERLGAVTSAVGSRWIPAAMPTVLGGATFVSGVVLLVSGATPSVPARIQWLSALVPLGVIELSHFLASLAGGALVVLGWALTRRLDAAYRLTQALLVVGAVASLLKGFDWEEATILASVGLLLVPARPVFYRRAAVTSEPFSPGWIVAIVAVVGFTAWLGFFSFKHVDYSSDLWWRFTLHGDAPRYLRAMVGLVAGITTFTFARLLRPAPPEPAAPTPAELERAAALVREGPSAMTNLALVGDKTLWFSDSGRGMLMFAVSGRSWVAMGDPLGPVEDRQELAWRFREEADRHGAWTVFYEVGIDNLPLYIDLGLTLLKLGEEAIVPLDDFSLEGGARRGLRRTSRELTKQGARFEVVSAEGVDALLPELARISDDWLIRKKVREKGFSLGRFDPAYLRRGPVGVVWVADRVVAFANLWETHPGGELSVDLMRYRHDAPSGVMEYLFIELMLWGQARGFRTFSLGMAPLAGLEQRALAPLWTRAGAFLFRHGENFYNFQGLRQYKDKFDPIWRPRYLASPAGLALPRILTNVATLISGGIGGIVSG
jgi:phosphatidylglycerol lysyltransferase